MELEDCGYESGSLIVNKDFEKAVDNDSITSSKEEVPEEGEPDSNSSLDESKEIQNANTSQSDKDTPDYSLWQLGQLAWARMSKYPFWPCTITHDPKSSLVFQKIQYTGRTTTHMIHVHFFNDNGQHSWIPSHKMFPFLGIEHFRQKAALLTDDIKKKEPQFASAFTVKPTLFRKWQIAVAEAMDVLYELDMRPLENFKPKLKDITNNSPTKTTKSPKVNRKRKKIVPISQTVHKYFKAGTASTSYRSTVNNDSEREGSPPAESSPERELTKAPEDQKQEKKKKINLQPPDFDVYFERNVDAVREQHPDVTTEEIRKYLLAVWDEMSAQEKLKYRGIYKVGGKNK